jgi:hypothetical protein
MQKLEEDTHIHKKYGVRPHNIASFLSEKKVTERREIKEVYLLGNYISCFFNKVLDDHSS